MAVSLRATRAMTVASIKMYFRNFTAVFFTFIFPVIFLVVFGFINTNQSLRLDVAVFNNSNQQIAEQFISALSQTYVDTTASESANEGKIIKLDNSSNVDEAKIKLADGDLNAIILVPEGFGRINVSGISDARIQLLTDNPNDEFSGIIKSLVDGILDRFNQQVIQEQVGTLPPPAFSSSFETIQSDNLEAIDYLVPGIIGFSIMSLGVFSITQGFIELKTNGSLRRLQVTPIRPINFLIAESATRWIMTLINVLTMALIGILFFNFTMHGNWVYFLIVATLGIVLFLGFGFAIAGWAKNADQAAPLSNIIFFPMMFLSGTFFPREVFPDWLKPMTEYLPLSYVSDGLREVANNAASLSDIMPEIVGMAVWTVVIYFIAVRLFRWE